MKKYILIAIPLFLFQGLSAQSLNKMQWYNEPEKWEIKSKGFEAKFENLQVTHLPDQRRLEWLKNQQE